MIGIIIILLPLLIYLLGALTIDRKTIQHPDDYFSAFRKVGKTEFASSSIAYGFQVSTIYPFLFWGAASFLFIPFVNAICWGIGILLFYFSVGKIQKYLGNHYTLHGFIGETYGSLNRTVASAITIIGFLGYIVAELWFGSRVMLSVVSDTNWLYLILFVFLIFIAGYLFVGGQLSSIRTDQLQLVITYVGVFGIIAYLFYLTIRNNAFLSSGLSWGIIICSILIPLILYVRKFSFIVINSSWDKVLNILVSFLFLAILILGLYAIGTSEKSFVLKGFFNLEGFGIAGLLSLTILPLSWQFVDLSNWQRLLAVKNAVGSNDNIDLKKGLLNYAFESPFTWILFIVFGLLAGNAFPSFSFEDILIDFPTQLIESELLIDQVAGYVFVVSIISIMLSTVDSFMMAIGFTYTYDLNSKSRTILDSKHNDAAKQELKPILKRGRIFSFLLILLGLLLFIFFDKQIEGGGELFINLLLTFYSAALAFLPLIIGKIFFAKQPKSNFAFASMVLGSFTGISIGIYGVIVNPDFAWYPIIASVVISFSVYFFGMVLQSTGSNVEN